MGVLRKLIDRIENIYPLYFFTIIFLVAFIVYGNSLFNGFVWDDEEQILKNNIIQSFSNFPYIFKGATFSTGGAGLSGWFFRPLLTFSFMLNYAFFGANAFGFHLFQIIFHALNGILLFKIIQSLLLLEKEKKVMLPSFLVSIIFIIHPGISEAVSYVSALSEVMYAFFGLAAIFLIIKNQKDIRIKKIIIISAFLFFALLYKESALAILPIIGSYFLIYKRAYFKRWLIYLGSIISLYFFTRLILAQTQIRHPEFSPISESPFLTRLMTIPLELFNYLRLVFYPRDLSISQHFVVNSPALSSFFLPLLIDIIFFGFIFYLALRLKSKLIIFGLIWFVFGFALISNIFPLDMTIAERWLYFPIIGLLLIFSAAFSILIKQGGLGYLALILLILSFFPLSARTIIRNSNWHDGLTLYSNDIKISKNSFDLENNLGVELFRNGETQKARQHFKRSIELQPKWYFAYNNLGVVYQKEGDFEKAKNLYQKTLSISDYYVAYENLAILLLKTEKPNETLAFVEKALKRLPNNQILKSVYEVLNSK